MGGGCAGFLSRGVFGDGTLLGADLRSGNCPHGLHRLEPNPSPGAGCSLSAVSWGLQTVGQRLATGRRLIAVAYKRLSERLGAVSNWQWGRNICGTEHRRLRGHAGHVSEPSVPCRFWDR
jgi:hypothetical protein